MLFEFKTSLSASASKVKLSDISEKPFHLHLAELDAYICLVWNTPVYISLTTELSKRVENHKIMKSSFKYYV